MSAHLYIVRHAIDGDSFISPCVGEDELNIHVETAGSFGAQLVCINDVESQLKRFVWDCCFEGAVKEWDRELG